MAQTSLHRKPQSTEVMDAETQTRPLRARQHPSRLLHGAGEAGPSAQLPHPLRSTRTPASVPYSCRIDAQGFGTKSCS